MNDVLKYTQLLCEVLKLNYQTFTTDSYSRTLNRPLPGIDVNYIKKQLQSIVNGTYDFNCEFVIESGSKYHKVIMSNNNSRSVHCFVDKKTGDVFKSASWKSPAKGIRANLLNDESRNHAYENCDWAGGWLYQR